MLDPETLDDLKTLGFEGTFKKQFDQRERQIAAEYAERKAEQERAAKLGMTVDQMREYEYREKNRALALPVATIVAEEVNWLWPEKVPRGMVTIFSGDPGLGKSFVTLDMAMRVSLGIEWPCEEEGEKEENTEVPSFSRDSVQSTNQTQHHAEERNGEVENENSAICNHHSAIRSPGGAILLNADDSRSKTIRPRLERMGANLENISVISDVMRNGYKMPFVLDRDGPMLKRAIKEMQNCQLVVLDPLSGYLLGNGGGKADARALVERLSDLAEEMNVAIVVVNHLRKGSGSAIHRSLGSISVIGRARGAWGFVRCKEEPARRLMVPLKNNLAADHEGLAYSIVDGRIEWESEPLTISADEAFLPIRKPRSPDALKKATEWLREKLGDGLPMLATEIEEEADRKGFSLRTLRRAKKELNVESKSIGHQGQWYCSLPAKIASS